MAESVLTLNRTTVAPAEARAFVRRELAARGLGELETDTCLAVSELVTNALIHTRGEVTVRVRPADAGVRVEVADASPVPPSPGMVDRAAMSGRGLLLVAGVSAAWGVEPAGDGKVVWFVVHPDHEPAGTGFTADDLLAMWDCDDEPAPRGADSPVHRQVRLVGLHTDLLVEVKARNEDLGREMSMVASRPQRHGLDLTELARRLARVMHELAPLRNAIRAQAIAAAARGDRLVDLDLQVAEGDAARIEVYADCLDTADELARRGRLLTVPAGARHAAFRREYLYAIACQARGEAAPQRRADLSTR